jgi:hypothetical protein
LIDDLLLPTMDSSLSAQLIFRLSVLHLFRTVAGLIVICALQHSTLAMLAWGLFGCTQNAKFFKIPRHIESLDVCMKH